MNILDTRDLEERLKELINIDQEDLDADESDLIMSVLSTKGLRTW